MAQDWHRMSAAGLGREIGQGRIDPVALTESYLDAIAGDPQSGDIYARVMHPRALGEARAAAMRAKSGLRRGPLDGVPVSWKDLFDSKGVATEAGSTLLKGRVPAQDATALRNATMAGLICLGKTHMSELAFSGLGYNPSTATPACVNDARAVAGGSSSGAAVSVARGLAAAAVGSDTGGSVRVPAAWNDLVGLKTTAGRLPLGGVVPLAKSFDTVGPLTRTVEDAALVLAALGDGHPADLRGATLQGTRMLALRTVALDDIEGAPMAAFESAVGRLQAAGATVHFGDIPEAAEAVALSAVLYTVEAYAEWRDVIEGAPELMFDQVRERFRAGAAFSGVDYLRARNAVQGYRQAWRAATAEFDAVLMPTCPIMPPKLARLMSEQDYYVTANLMTLRNTRIANLMGLPALTLPTGLKSTGISLLGAAHGEERLLRLGMAAESALA